MACKHWFVENYKIGPQSERWIHCPYCGENRKKAQESGKKGKSNE